MSNSGIISHVSKFITLKTGDLIFTGTPYGVGPVHPGDLLEGHITLTAEKEEKLLEFYVK